MADKRKKKPATRSRTRGVSTRTSAAAADETTPARHATAAITLHGAVESSASVIPEREVKITTKAALRPASARAGEKQASADIADDDVIEIEFEGGERLWLNGAEYKTRFLPQTTREANAPLQLPRELQLLPEGMQTRGPVAWVVKSLKVLGIDLADKTAEQIGKLVENRKSAKRPGLGLFHCSLQTNSFALTAPRKLSGSEPILLFLHGTFSTTWGSFGDLWSPARSAELDQLRDRYADRVLAFEHAYMTHSPINNALDLVRALKKVLPAGARVHVVSHSRGGLVGELLSRASMAQQGQPPFQRQEFDLLSEPQYAKLQSELRALDQELQKPGFTVERFVRVGCPALGTTLASGRLDRWISVFGSVFSHALPGTPLADTFTDVGDFFAAVLQERTDPKTLPGIEAMMPESAFIKLINWPNARPADDLTVIAGDIDPDKWWARLIVWLSDKFYEGDHDIVVNTASMYGGAKRAESAQALASFHKGKEVNHFNYFKNADSSAQLVRALTRKREDTSGFEPLHKPVVEIARAVLARDAGARPVVFVLPGIMGSELCAGDDKVWVDIPDLMFGGLRQLRIEAKNVRATNPLARHYGALMAHLAQSHKVIPFAYDWRLPVEQEADRLAQEIKRELKAAKAQNQPVRLLAHSMGGLVSRCMIARHEALWREMCEHPQARLVMLGTPNGGSHSITEMLVGQSGTLRKLALIDVRNTQKQLLEIIARFPGVLAMLPKDSREDYFDPKTWEGYRSRAGGDWVIPQAADLTKAREFRRLIDSAPIDNQRMLYVAGCADVTLASMHFDADASSAEQRIRFLATTRGDGRVTWDSGIPSPQTPTWFMDVEHGDLAAHEDSFAAIEELLTQGNTNLLPRSLPESRAAEVLFPRPRAAEELYPDAEGLSAQALGAGARKRRKAITRERPVQVCVSHGNLAYAAHPVAVGHYAGDTIISAERFLDGELDHALSKRHQLGLYPGPIETSAIFINANRTADIPLQGAIVIGLGQVGSLSAASLSRSFTRALLEYVLEWNERGPAAQPQDAQVQSFGVTALLIGTGAAGISVSDSVYALLQGLVRANQTMAAAKQPWRIGQLEFIELWEDRALQAIKALGRLQDHPQLRDQAVINPLLQTRPGNLRRLSYEEPEGWWHRIQILGGGKSGEPGDGTLRFTASTRRARNEVRLLGTQRALVDDFVKQSIRTTRDNRATAQTLFELLLPNDLKDQAPDQDNLVLVVDEEAARYPWELMQDPASQSGNPFVIEHGLLRQLESYEFRAAVRAATANNALVVGDPLSKYPELKGAQKEAEAVWSTLQRGGFQSEKHIRPSSDEVVAALYARPYRILHLAGHGVYQFPVPGEAACASCGHSLPAPQHKARHITGMIIGDDAVLSPHEVEQMRQVPELVFINCCHLGFVEAGGNQSDNQRNDFNRIAANVATQFIRIGVRAVIAAGWAVEDDAANVFATTFYDTLLNDFSFGEAVKRARAETYSRYPNSNTWGAYQCYGDPDYTLRGVAASSKPKDRSYASVLEVVSEIDNTGARLATAANRNAEWHLKYLKQLDKDLSLRGWQSIGRALTALGRAYGEANQLDLAIEYYRKALNAEDGSIALNDVERLLNFEVRRAPERLKDTAARDVTADLQHAVTQLQALASTSERLALIGSAYKRMARINADDPTSYLQRMSNAYRQAYDLAAQSERFDSYALSNWVAAELALSWHHPRTRQQLAAIDKQAAQAQPRVDALRKSDVDFWSTVTPIDLALLRLLLAPTQSAKAIDQIAKDYLAARTRASPRQFASVMDQFDFLLQMARKKKPVNRQLLELKQRLTTD